jgi:hypothetical protein
MPLPKPQKGERLRFFMDRCRSNPIMNKEYPKRDVRAGVCRSQFDRKDKS